MYELQGLYKCRVPGTQTIRYSGNLIVGPGVKCIIASHQDLSPVWGFLYFYPTDLWVKEHEQLIGTMITAATFHTLEGKK